MEIGRERTGKVLHAGLERYPMIPVQTQSHGSGVSKSGQGGYIVLVETSAL